jgi:hypothetical protein
MTKGEPVRLHVRGQVLGYKRSKANQVNHTALIKVGLLLSLLSFGDQLVLCSSCVRLSRVELG